MKEHPSSLAASDSSAAGATCLRLVRSPAAVGVLLAVLILLLAWPRLTGPSWTTLQMPFDLRESEGNTVQWEQIHQFNALRATLQSDAAPIITGHYGTDHYRGLLPIYVSAIFSWWLDSSYKGLALVDLLGWWIAAWSVYHLARRLDTDRLSALMAAVLLVASPLLISHMWRNAVHVAHSASLVPYFLIALLLLIDKRLARGWHIIGLAGVLYAASLTYQYQWIIVPCLLPLVIVEKRRVAWVLSIIIATVLFVVITFLTYQALSIVGLSVYSQSNDPLAVVGSRLALIINGNALALISSFSQSIGVLINSYHPFILLLSILGLVFARTRLRILVVVGTALGLTSAYFHPVPWVAMNGYPFLYISAGLALVQAPRRLAASAAQISSRYPRFAQPIASGSRMLAVISMVVLVFLTMWITNTDLFGDYSFAQQWWDFTYVPR